ncbi:PucR family transcriptional regulator [Gordonia liuliyuniae]|uniref:Helix-turn-helix domain-containing protein n=1 Tax=Gordonia liuliyuniae TaxID=2911517 RepID=A0ABS9IUJ5_9ACTN|nr:helix-turn-helix domain-containing protein [Gordonia liuliyuniae]MCF8589196.1 helix-turn-helix domain-containing protein [Gordonia liuliyuniae]
MIDDAALTERLHEIARRLRDEEVEVTAAIMNAIVAGIDRLGDDPGLTEMLQASVHGNVTTIIHVLANDIPVDRLQPTTAAVEYALRLAQREVPSNSLVRAYHIGQIVLLRDVFAKVDELGLNTSDSMEVLRRVSDVVYRYIDWITRYVFDAYEQERQRWMGVQSHMLTSAIHALLGSTPPDEARLQREIRYRLDQRHSALILWSTDDDVSVRDLDRTARSLAARLHADGDPLITAIDRRTVWMWVPHGARAKTIGADTVRSALTSEAGIGAAVGLPGVGVPGFRRSHQQAQSAFTVATMKADHGGTTDPVVAYGDRGVAVVALLARDVDSTRAWVHDVLGPLATPGETAAVLRETLSAYYATGDSHLRAAERLTVHRNTVKYRVTKALAEAPASDRLDISVALIVCEFLGDAVLGDGPR